MRYSQNNEEDYILDYFKENNNGVFVEIGGYNPFKFSNTRKLVEKGWSGTYVEPSPSCMKSFVDEYSNNEKIVLCDFAITPMNQGRMKFYDSGGDAISSLDTAHVDKWTKGWNVKYAEIEVETMAMSDFLFKYGRKCDFLNLDVEGVNIDLFNVIPDWFFINLQCACIEHDSHIEEIRNKLLHYGFKELCLNGENIIMGK